MSSSSGQWSGGGGAVGGKPSAWDPTVTGIAGARLADALWSTRSAAGALRSAPDLAVVAAPGVDVAGLRWCASELEARAAAADAIAAALERLREETMLAGRAYEWASERVRSLIEEVAGGVASTLGTAVRGAALAVAPWAVAIGLVAVPLAARIALANPSAAIGVAERARAAGVDLERFLGGTSAFWDSAGEVLMANPLFASALAVAVESTDEALAGLLGIPVPLARRLESEVGDDELLGLVALAAAGGVGLSSAGRVRPVFSRPVPPPEAPVTDPAEAMRIVIEQDEQVTIHEHRMPDGSTRWQVFVRGTQLDDPSGLDLRANLENAGSLENAPGLEGLHGSDAAVAQAMRDAGVRPGDAVDLFGFSQGASAVANVAATGEFSVETALLVGGPVGATELPPGVTALSVAHAGDLVPALDGWSDEGGVPTTVVVSAGGHGSGPLARHSGLEYAETLDGLDDFVADAYRERLAAGAAGGAGVAGVSVHLRRR